MKMPFDCGGDNFLKDFLSGHFLSQEAKGQSWSILVVRSDSR